MIMGSYSGCDYIMLDIVYDEGFIGLSDDEVYLIWRYCECCCWYSCFCEERIPTIRSARFSRYMTESVCRSSVWIGVPYRP